MSHFGRLKLNTANLTVNKTDACVILLIPFSNLKTQNSTLFIITRDPDPHRSPSLFFLLWFRQFWMLKKIIKIYFFSIFNYNPTETILEDNSRKTQGIFFFWTAERYCFLYQMFSIWIQVSAMQLHSGCPFIGAGLI